MMIEGWNDIYQVIFAQKIKLRNLANGETTDIDTGDGRMVLLWGNVNSFGVIGINERHEIGLINWLSGSV
jgi:hypothetical protein